MAQPEGIRLPFRRAIRTFPSASALVAMSITMGGSCCPGKPTAVGLILRWRKMRRVIGWTTAIVMVLGLVLIDLVWSPSPSTLAFVPKL